MIDGKYVTALIPARGGSKRLPRKNVLDLAGRPLIAWTIDAAISSKYVDRVVVSTDDAEIAEVSRHHGAEVPFLRPEALSGDAASTNSVILHCINSLGCSSDGILVLLQPTSPLRTATDVDRALEMLLEKNALGVVSVCECEHSPLWSNTLGAEMSMDGFIVDKLKGVRSQDLPKYYRINGAIYAYTVLGLVARGGVYYDKGVYATEMEQLHSVDIDTEIDFELASIIMSNLRSKLKCDPDF